MITYVHGDLLQSPARVLVNPVNTVGAMGKGLAADFKRCYPAMFESYRALCDEGRIDVGKLWLYRTPHKWVLNFPTKKHWRQPAQLDDIELGLRKFVAIYAEQGITSVSFPMLGVGSGRLDWEDVRPLMEAYLAPLPVQVYIHLFDPARDPRISPRAIAAWHATTPQVIPFDRFWRDLVRQMKRQAAYETLDDRRTFHVAPDDKPRSRNLLLKVGRQPDFISENTLSELWTYIRGAGYVLPANLPSGVHAHGPCLTALLGTLPYLSPVKLTPIGGTAQTGLLYFPPAAKDPTRTESMTGAEQETHGAASDHA